MDNLPLLNQGQRAVLCGRTGSGKSTLANWLAIRSPGHWLILNPKGTSAYKNLPDCNTVKGINLNKIEKSLEEYRFTNLIPSPGQSTAENMDAFVEYMHQSYTGVGLIVDELYSMHKNGQAGQGLIAWLTRGRELKQSFLGLTQRPAWVSKFVFSESDYVGGMSLVLSDDRKKMYEMTGQSEMLGVLPEHEWLWYDIRKNSLRYLAPVPLS